MKLGLICTVYIRNTITGYIINITIRTIEFLTFDFNLVVTLTYAYHFCTFCFEDCLFH